MKVQRHVAAVLLAAAVGLTGCGGDDGVAEGAPTTTEGVAENSTTTTTEAAALTEIALPSGASVSYPSDWTSYGAGFAGSLELNIPGVANVSVRDAAASEYLYGPLLPDQESLQGAFAMFEFGMGTAEIGEPALTTVDGREMLVAEVVNGGRAGLMAVMESGDSYASVYAESPSDSLAPEAIASILQVLASTTP